MMWKKMYDVWLFGFLPITKQHVYFEQEVSGVINSQAQETKIVWNLSKKNDEQLFGSAVT